MLQLDCNDGKNKKVKNANKSDAMDVGEVEQMKAAKEDGKTGNRKVFSRQA